MNKENIITATSVPQLSQIVINTKRYWGNCGSLKTIFRDASMRMIKHVTTTGFAFSDSPQGREYWGRFMSN